MNRAAILKIELALLTDKFNANLAKMDQEVQRALWRAALDAAAEAFTQQTKADLIRATGEHMSLGHHLSKSQHRAVAETEAEMRERMADAFQELSREFVRMMDTVPSIAKEAGIKL